MSYQMFINTPFRKKVSIIIVSVTILIFSVLLYYYLSIYKSFSVVEIHASYRGIGTFEELEKVADIILIGTPTEEYSDRKTNETKFSDGNLQDITTVTKIKVEKTLKQPKDLNVPEIFSVIEPGGITQTFNGKVKLELEHYQDLVKGKKYVLYLKKNINGDYSILNFNNGQFSLEEDLTKPYNNYQDNKIKQSVFKKYR